MGQIDMTLEQFRLDSIQQIKDNSELIKKIILNKLKLLFTVYIHGSVLDKKKFTENSDVDIIVYLKESKLKKGPNEMLTERLRNEFQKYPFMFGILDVIVVNNEKLLKNQIKL